MKTLDVYIGKNILTHVLVVMGVLLGLFTFVNLIDELDNLGVGKYNFWEIIKYIVYTTPRNVYEIFPMTALLGAVLGLSSMANDSELTVMRAAGISLNRIAFSMVKVGLILATIALVIGEFVLPKSDPIAENNRSVALEKQTRQQTALGFWVKDQNVFVNIDEVLPDLTLVNLKVFEFDANDTLRSIVKVGRALYTTQPGEAGNAVKVWVMKDVEQTVFSNDFRSVDYISSLEAKWNTLITPSILNVFLTKPDQLAIWDLQRYIFHLEANKQDTDSYKLTFWQKLILPVSTTVMMFVAIPFVFVQVRGGGMGPSLFIGIMLGILFFIMQRGFGFFVLAYGIPPIIGALLPTAAFLLLGLWLIQRIR